MNDLDPFAQVDVPLRTLDDPGVLDEVSGVRSFRGRSNQAGEAERAVSPVYLTAVYPQRHSPLRQKVLRALGPHNLLSRTINQPRNGLCDDEVEEFDRSAEGWFSFGREGEAIVSDFMERETEGPDVGFDGVGQALDAFGLKQEALSVSGFCTSVRRTHRHVEGRPRKRPRKTIHQLPTNPEVTELDLSLPRHQHVARLNISVNDLPLVQVIQPSQHGLRDLSQNLLARSSTSSSRFADQSVDGAGFAEFHEDRDTGIRGGEEGTVVIDDVWRAALVEEL